MGEEGERSGFPEEIPQGAGYAPLPMQPYSGQYTQGSTPMQPGIRGSLPPGRLPSSCGSAPPGSRPQWLITPGVPGNGPLVRSPGDSGPPNSGPPLSAGPPGQGSTGNRSYGGCPPGPSGAPPGTAPMVYPSSSVIALSQIESTSMLQPARPFQVPSSGHPGPPRVPLSFPHPHGPPPGAPPAPSSGQVSGHFSQSTGQDFRAPTGNLNFYHGDFNTIPNVSKGLAPYVQGPPRVSQLSQNLQRLSVGRQSQGLPGSFGPCSFSAPGPPISGPPQITPSTWQSSQRRVYPDASAGQPPNASMPIPGAPRQVHAGQLYVPGGMVPGPPSLSQTGSPAGGQPGSARIDRDQIPRPQLKLSTVTFDTRVDGLANLPPSATTNFIVRDMGNCSPRMMRCTLNQIPVSSELLAASGMPLAVIIQPLALLHPAEDPIQIVDFGESGPVRCAAPHCKGYINPFVKFIDHGRQFLCNLCGHTSETPLGYYCNLGPEGRRRDADSRPELVRGTVEFVAPKEYQVRPPMPHVFFFLVDVSSRAASTGAVGAACTAINRALAALGENSQIHIGVATFDSHVHFYNLNKNLQTPSMLVVPDTQEMYLPLQNNLIVPLKEGREHLEQLLETIPSIFQNNRIPDSAFGAAVKGAYLAMKPTGGKLIVFQSVLPSVGLGALSPREGEGKLNEKEAQKLMQPSDKTLKTMALDLAEAQVCVDLFLTSKSYLDIASLAVIPHSTGGQIYYYHGFQASVDSAKLDNDLRWNVTRPQALEAVMRVRCSSGLQVRDYFGNFCKRAPTDVDLSAIDCDKTIMVTFKYDDRFEDNAECCFQSALLYTTTNGERRIRVNTLSLSCTHVLTTLFRGADLDAQFTYLLKKASQEVIHKPVVQARDHIVDDCVSILCAYRKFCATTSSPGQLILPEALKLLPLYTLALIKSVGLRMDVRVDDRSYWLSRVTSLSAALAIPLVYPRMFAVHNLQSKEELGGGILPSVVPLSSENLEHDGIFLLETGEDSFLYVGREASPQTLQHLFGVRSVDEVVAGEFLLQEYNNELSKRLNEVLNEIRRQRCSYLRLRLLKRGDPQGKALCQNECNLTFLRSHIFCVFGGRQDSLGAILC